MRSDPLQQLRKRLAQLLCPKGYAVVTAKTADPTNRYQGTPEFIELLEQRKYLGAISAAWELSSRITSISKGRYVFSGVDIWYDEKTGWVVAGKAREQRKERIVTFHANLDGFEIPWVADEIIRKLDNTFKRKLGVTDVK